MQKEIREAVVVATHMPVEMDIRSILAQMGISFSKWQESDQQMQHVPDQLGKDSYS